MLQVTVTEQTPRAEHFRPLTSMSPQTPPTVPETSQEEQAEETLSTREGGDETMEDVEDPEDDYSMSYFRVFSVYGPGRSNCSSCLVDCGCLLGSSTPTSTLTWICWFCSLPGHEYFCEVSEDFIEDDFNLTGLNTMVPFWKEAMEMVLDVEPGTLSSWDYLNVTLISCCDIRRGYIEDPRCFDRRSISRATLWARAPTIYSHTYRIASYGKYLCYVSRLLLFD